MKKILILSLIIFSIIFWFFINWDVCSASADSFNLDTLFTEVYKDENNSEKKDIKTFEQAIWAIVKAITWLIWWFAVLWTILWGFMILTSWWSDDWMNKWKKIIMYSLIWIAVSLVSYTLIQLVQMFLFSFE